MLYAKVICVASSLAPFLPCSVLGASLRRNSSPQQITVNNNFETDMNNDPIASTQEIGVYNLLYWTMGLATLGVDGVFVSGNIPHTPSNVASFTQRSELTDGTPMISANYLTSQIQSFTLSSMYYSCAVATAETLAGPSAPCTITATAFNKNNVKLATQSFNFATTGAATQQQVPGYFGSGFQNAYYVIFNVTNALTTVAQLDNVVTTLTE